MKPRVLFVAAEAVPLAKTGGLADVIGALADALQRRGIDMTVLLPAYPSAIEAAGRLRPGEPLPARAGLPSSTRLLLGTMPGSDVGVALLDAPELFDRPGSPYLDAQGHEFADNARRFAALCQTAVQIAAGHTEVAVPDLVHVHDWHAGLVPLLLKRAGLAQPVALTIHNLAFQGVFPKDVGSTLGLPDDWASDPTLDFWGQLSFMKAGLEHADRITTVSPSYAREILTERFGHGLDGVLRHRQDRLGAIRNGVDTETWDPGRDESIARTYSVRDPGGRQQCKRALQNQFGLQVDPFAPVLALGSRITTQKMADVALAALQRVLESNARVQVAVLGCGDAALEQGFRELANRWRGRVGVHIGYSEPLAHALHAGADLLLHGSRFEPFGLTPVYAMRYGCVPVVSRVGGLMDTVIDAGSFDRPVANATGFTFEGDTAEAMHAAIDRALQWFARPAAWRLLQRHGMKGDFGWETPADQYVALYRAMSVATPAREITARPRNPFDRPLLPSANSADLTAEDPSDAFARVAVHGG